MNNSPDQDKIERTLLDTIWKAGDALPESPIEDIFEERFLPSLEHNNVTFRRQHQIKTICGQFRIDFSLYHEDINLGIECDGKDYHDEEYDRWRDALILGSGKIKDIVRIDGSQIHRNVYCCIYQIKMMYPYLFSLNGQKRISSLAINEIRNQLYDQRYFASRRWDVSPCEIEHIEKSINEISEEDIMYYSYITRRSRELDDLKSLFLFAKENQCSNINELIRLYNNK